MRNGNKILIVSSSHACLLLPQRVLANNNRAYPFLCQKVNNALASSVKVVLGRPLARCRDCPFPLAPHQTGRASFNAYSFPFVHSVFLCRVGCPLWMAW